MGADHRQPQIPVIPFGLLEHHLMGDAVDVLATPPANEPTPPRSGPACVACGEPAVVNWRRRLTDDELAEHIRVEEERREQALLLADPQLPAPVFPPLPTGEDTRTLYACADHAIGMELAARIHQATCGAPFVGSHGKLFVDADGIPVCDCTPNWPPSHRWKRRPVRSCPTTG